MHGYWKRVCLEYLDCTLYIFNRSQIYNEIIGSISYAQAGSDDIVCVYIMNYLRPAIIGFATRFNKLVSFQSILSGECLSASTIAKVRFLSSVSLSMPL